MYVIWRGFLVTDKNRMTENSVKGQMMKMIKAIYQNQSEEIGKQSTVYEPVVKAIPLGTTIYTQEQLEKFLCYVADTYVEDSHDHSLTR